MTVRTVELYVAVSQLSAKEVRRYHVGIVLRREFVLGLGNLAFRLCDTLADILCKVR